MCEEIVTLSGSLRNSYVLVTYLECVFVTLYTTAQSSSSRWKQTVPYAVVSSRQGRESSLFPEAHVPMHQ